MICSLLFIGYPEGQDTVYHISKTVGTEIALKEGQEGEVKIKYTGTVFYYICLVISIIGAISFIIYIIVIEVKKKEGSNK